MLLTDADLKAVTGYTVPARQKEWLRDAGIPFKVSRDGRPVLTWGIFERAVLQSRQAPNFDFG